MRICEKMKKVFCLLLAVIMVLLYVPALVLAEEISQLGLCEHHPVHENCGYAEAVEGKACEFVCEECKKQAAPICSGTLNCLANEHNEDCEKKAAVDKSATDQVAADKVAVLIDALPSLESIQAKAWENQLLDYNQIQSAYGDYQHLTEDQKALLPVAEEVFKLYFDYFNSRTVEAAASGTCGENLTWTLADGVLTISGDGTMTNFDGTNVPWSEQRETITSVRIEDGVTSVGDGAFDYCSMLNSISIPDSVTYIGHSAFRYCLSLNSITIPSSVDFIGVFAFYNCTSLSSIIIPNGVTSIGDSAFSECSSLTSIIIPDSVTSIDKDAFDSCTSLSNITIPNGVTSIGDFAFSECSSLTSIIIPDSIASIGKGAFQYCKNLSSITIPNGVTSIGDSLFDHCSSLSSVTIPNSVTSIGNDMFDRCTSLSSIIIPDSITHIGSYSFYGCDSLADVYYSGSAEQWTVITIASGNETLANATIHYNASVPETTLGGSFSGGLTWSLIDSVLVIGGEGVMTTSPGLGGTPWYDYRDDITKIVIQDGVTSIGYAAFWGLSNLISVEIPGTVTVIGRDAFGNCTSLETVKIPEGVTSIEMCAFSGCSSLKKVELPKTVKEIQKVAFENCFALEGFIVPEGVTVIEECTFQGCYSLANLYISASVTSIGQNALSCSYGFTNPKVQDIYFGGTEENWENISANAGLWSGAVVHFNSTGLGGEGEDSIVASGACGQKLTWKYDETTQILTISGTGEMDSYVYTGEDLPWLSYRYDITSAVVENGVTTIGDHAFVGCENITSIAMPNTLVSIGYSAFNSCDSLTSVVIPDSVTDLGDDLFYNCSGLKEVTLPQNITAITGGMFRMCTGLERVTIPAGVTEIESLAFYGCSSLNFVEVPEGVTDIGGNAFQNCTGLSQISMPKSLSAVRINAFQNCTALTDVYYAGSREDWNNLIPYISSGNDSLLNEENIHFGEETVVKLKDVRYYSNWNETLGMLYFGVNDTEGCFVSAETDTEFLSNPEAFLGKYVIVETKQAEGKEILLSMKAVESTDMGTVVSVDSDEIQIQITPGKTMHYATPVNLENCESLVNGFILFHTDNGNLAEVEIMTDGVGYLLYSDQETDLVKIAPTSDGTGAAFYCISSIAAGETHLLGSNEKVRLKYWADSNNLIYKIAEAEYSPYVDGWSFQNGYEGFPYSPLLGYRIPEKRYEEVFGKSYVASAQASAGQVFTSMMPVWNGNCHGMSFTSVLFYLEMLDWQTYGDSSFNTVNAYYAAVNDNGSWYYTTAGISSDIVQMIERYQILTFSSEQYERVDSTYNEVVPDYCSPFKKQHEPDGNYIQTVLNRILNASEPLVMDLQYDGGAHTVVIRMDKEPEQMPDGWWRVYIYDPNRPCFPSDILNLYRNNFAPYYSNDTDYYVELLPGPGGNLWRWNGSINGQHAVTYHGCDENGNVLYFSGSPANPEYLYVYSIKDIDLPLKFNGTEPWRSKFEDMSGFNYAPGASFAIYDSVDGTLICSAENGVPVTWTDGVEVHMNAGEQENSTGSVGGQIWMPYTQYRVEYKEGADISILGCENVINFVSTGSAVLNISASDGRVTVENSEDAKVTIQLTNVYDNAHYSSVVADGSMAGDDVVTLCLKEDRFTGDFTGSGVLELTTDNEASPESRSIGILDEAMSEAVIADVRQEHTHTYELSGFNWAEDHTCIATFGCISGDGIQTANCTVTSSMTPATETEAGKIVYTATVDFAGQTYTDTKTETIPATGHNTHQAGSKWISDGMQHWHKCTGCDAKLDIASHSGGTATCVNKAVCKICGQSYGEKNLQNHSFTKYHSDDNATCKKNGTKTAKCDYGCGKTDTITDRGSKLGHKFDGDKCVRCGVSRWNPDTGDKIMIAVTVLVISGGALLILLSKKKRK